MGAAVAAVGAKETMNDGVAGASGSAARVASIPSGWYRGLWVAAGLAVVGAVVAELTRPVADPAVPVALVEFLGEEQVAAAETYRAPLRVASLVSRGLRIAAAGLLLWWAARSDAGSRWLQVRSRRRSWQRLVGLGAVAAAAWAITDLVRLPLQLWARTRSVDVGLSTQDLTGWFRDYVVTVGPQWIGVALAAIAGVVLRERLGRQWVPVAALLAGLVGAILVVVSPRVFEPLLFDFTPLPAGELRDGITELADTAPFDAEILVADASRRTTAANAYVSGIAGTRRIVLYDTLIEDTPTPVILATVAHEIAHTEHRDLERTALSLFGIAVVIVWVLDRVMGETAVGASGRVRASGVVRAVAVLVVGAVLIAPIGQWSSRRTERAADQRALEILQDGAVYREMLLTLAERNLSDPDPPAWIVGLAFSHPPMPERVGRAEAATR
ncbi:M48 family metalloprotease [Euzebya tangerina]|uniref:M48 family metalloprotease n=1 Tax=Euzebya tangerina TaxID=591198 RepID=UPI000E312CAB|nr:M48 family metalloprotease [Euzebya tangerina]